MAPFVSVLTPTYNRRRFLPSMIECYKSQTYPKGQMEWILLDDGTDCVRDVLEGALVKGIPNVRYIRLDEKISVGAKRNILNKEARGEIMVAMDDDDFYHPDRVRHAVQKLVQNPRCELAGSSEVFVFYTDIQEIYNFGPYGTGHCTSGTMAYRRAYAMAHSYDETVTQAEERSFLDSYVHPMIQLDPRKVMLVISHSENTFDKKKLREQASPLVRRTSLKIRDFIRSAPLRIFYSAA